MAERGIFRRAIDIVTGRTAYSPDEAKKFIKFMDDAVAPVFRDDPSLLDDPKAQVFLDAVRRSAVQLEVAAVRGRRISRRTIAIGGAGLLVGGLLIRDALKPPYVSEELTKPMSDVERLAYENDHQLAKRESAASSRRWKLSYEPYDPTLKFVDNTEPGAGQWIKNHSNGQSINFFTESLTDAEATNIWPTEFRTVRGEMVPVLEVKVGNGTQANILATGPVEGLDTEAVKFSRLSADGKTPLHRYMSIKRIETSQGVVFEARLKKRVPRE